VIIGVTFFFRDIDGLFRVFIVKSSYLTFLVLHRDVIPRMYIDKAQLLIKKRFATWIMLSLSTFRSLKMCFCFVDVCARADIPGKTARATTSPAIRHRVKTEARAISSANMTTSASALKVSTAQTFYPISRRGISPRYIPHLNPAKDETFSYQHVRSPRVSPRSFLQPHSPLRQNYLVQGNRNDSRVYAP